MFREDQKVICINDTGWYESTTGRITSGPAHEEITIIKSIEEANGFVYLEFYEYPGDKYVAYNFRPLEDNFAEEVLSNALEQVEQEETILI